MATQESEAKFRARSDLFPDLMRVHRLGDFLRVEDQRRQHVDTYFDTPALRLYSLDSGLRIRSVIDGPVHATFKGASTSGAGDRAVHRTEIESQISYEELEIPGVAFPLAALSSVPAFLAAHELIGDVMIGRIATIVASRTSVLLRHPGNGAVELSIDRCVGTRSSDGRQLPFSEVELEVVDGDVDALDYLAGELMALVPGLEISQTSKLARTLEGEESP